MLVSRFILNLQEVFQCRADPLLSSLNISQPAGAQGSHSSRLDFGASVIGSLAASLPAPGETFPEDERLELASVDCDDGEAGEEVDAIVEVSRA